MRLFVAIAVFFALIAAEYFALPWLEPIFGPDLVSNGPGWLLLPAIGSYLGWLITESLMTETIRIKLKRSFTFLSPRLRFYLVVALCWEFFILAYLLFTKTIGQRFQSNDWMTLVACILIPPFLIFIGQSVLYFMSTVRSTRTQRINELIRTVKEKLNSLPAIMQLLGALMLTITVFNISSGINQFLQLFTFVTALISIGDAYKNDENFPAALFIIIACLYNPFYPIPIKHEAWVVVNFLVAIIFSYKISAIISREKLIDKELLNIAINIDASLKEIDKSTKQYTFIMLERYIKHKHPYLSNAPNEALKWQESGLHDFTFSVLDVFNGHGAISVTGINAFRGFKAFLVFHNQNLRWMIFLENNASASAKRLKKIMVKDLRYVCFEPYIS